VRVIRSALVVPCACPSVCAAERSRRSDVIVLGVDNEQDLCEYKNRGWNIHIFVQRSF
jgi:hypothetical protein